MCKKVMWTAGCTFATAEEASAAIAKTDARAEADADCKVVTFTAGCTFGSIEEAASAAQPHLDKMSGSLAGCGAVTGTIACTY